MRISDLRGEFTARLAAFAWEQWAQLGFQAATDRRDRWATDPEALILLTLEAGRDDPRLFDELLDWLLVNERLISTQRLRNLTGDVADQALLDGALDWLGQRRPRARLTRGVLSTATAPAAEPLFRSLTAPVTKPDEAFRAVGLLRPLVTPRGHSQPPDFTAPIAFAFRLRQILGISARAEAVRALLTNPAPSVQVQVIAESAAYAKRNVQEALSALHAARVIVAVDVANERRYRIDRARWATLLGITADQVPAGRDWAQHFQALRLILRWLNDPERDRQSDYMRASDARQLMDEIRPLLLYAGMQPTDGTVGNGYWGRFSEAILRAIPSAGPTRTTTSAPRP